MTEQDDVFAMRELVARTFGSLKDAQDLSPEDLRTLYEEIRAEQARESRVLRELHEMGSKRP